MYVAAIGRVEETIWLPYDAGLSAAAETLERILKRVIVSPAVYPRFLEIAELARSLCHSWVTCLIAATQRGDWYTAADGIITFGTHNSSFGVGVYSPYQLLEPSTAMRAVCCHTKRRSWTLLAFSENRWKTTLPCNWRWITRQCVF